MAEYSDSLLLQSAVERQLEILGEAARRIPETFHQKHPEIDWRGIIGLRNMALRKIVRTRGLSPLSLYLNTAYRMIVGIYVLNLICSAIV